MPSNAKLSKPAAYGAVQAAAMKAWDGDGDFLEILKAEPAIAERLNAARLAACFDLAAHTRHVDTIFKRVFGAE